MVDWFLSLPMEDRILLITVLLAFIALLLPGVTLNFRNIIKAIIFVIAALLVYSLFSGESPTNLLQKATTPPADQKAPTTVPKYYEDPEKRWQQ